MKSHRRQVVSPTPLVASSPALEETFSAEHLFNQMVKRTIARQRALGLTPTFTPEQLDELEREVDDDDDPEDEKAPHLVETFRQRVARADKLLAEQHIRAKVREAELLKKQVKEEAEAGRRREAAVDRLLAEARTKGEGSPEPSA